jgi:hypothetical protein
VNARKLELPSCVRLRKLRKWAEQEEQKHVVSERKTSESDVNKHENSGERNERLGNNADKLNLSMCALVITDSSHQRGHRHQNPSSEDESEPAENPPILPSPDKPSQPAKSNKTQVSRQRSKSSTNGAAPKAMARRDWELDCEICCKRGINPVRASISSYLKININIWYRMTVLR